MRRQQIIFLAYLEPPYRELRLNVLRPKCGIKFEFEAFISYFLSGPRETFKDEGYSAFDWIHNWIHLPKYVVHLFQFSLPVLETPRQLVITITPWVAETIEKASLKNGVTLTANFKEAFVNLLNFLGVIAIPLFVAFKDRRVRHLNLCPSQANVNLIVQCVCQ